MTLTHGCQSRSRCEVHVHVKQPGFRTDSFVVVTTLTDAETYTAEEIGDLFRKRWLAELDIRALKSTLGMDVLRCQTPEMVRKEIWAALLACNLIRQAMLQAALQADLSPRELSFTHALVTVAASWMTVAQLSPRSSGSAHRRRSERASSTACRTTSGSH